jgi:hypothetical protein
MLTEEEEWRQQCRQQLRRDLATRIKYGFCHVYKPVLDDTPFRAFATMAEYRDWCQDALPPYLGYRRIE